MSLTPELQAAVDATLLERPTEWLGRFRAADKPLATWLTNVSYWRAFPQKPPTIDKGDKAGGAAWLAMHAEIARALLAEQLPPIDAARPRWPLASPPRRWGSGASFGARRPARKSKPQTRYHAGIDLDAQLGDPVLAPEAGTVVAVGLGWEAPTKAVLLHLDSGRTLLLGGVKMAAPVAAGQRVAAGQPVAEVEAYPLGDTMLHVQLYDGHQSRQWVQQRRHMQWQVGDPQPDGLLDPSEYLDQAAANTQLIPADALVGAFGVASAVDPLYDSAEENEGFDGFDQVLDIATTGFVTVAVVGTVMTLAVGGALVYWLTRDPAPVGRRADRRRR